MVTPYKRRGQDNSTALLIAGELGPNRPEFLRLAKTGKLCPVTQLSRSVMNNLILPCEANDYRPPVRSVSLRKKHAVRGVRLIPTDELLAYLRQELENQNKGGN